ncbi:ubiquitinyl hydrolase 1 [Quaeritorhiza haematococci]|nr:ubiquitinyl hydrolase 1 [Quaeritorhiza haematococci]
MNHFLTKLGLRAKKDHRVLMVGLDCVGKTTLLYQLKLGEVVTTIPTIGFNVETIPLNDKINCTFWDVGGCDKIRPLWRHYFANTQIVMMVVDPTDRDRWPEFVELFEAILRAEELSSCPFVVVVNKMDCEGAMTLEEVEEKVRGVAKEVGGDGYEESRFSFVPAAATSKEGTRGIIPALLKAVPGPVPETKPNPPTNALPNKSNAMPPVADLLERIKSGKDEPASSDEFLAHFKEGQIVLFDHRAHIRIAFIVLSQALNQGSGVSEATQQFVSTLQTFFAKADRTRIRNTFHLTMTTFWCNMVVLSIMAYSAKLGRPLVGDDFPKFLEENPTLMWSGLWSLHYTKDKLFTKEAAAEFLPPDLKPFPSAILLSQPPKDNLTALTTLEADPNANLSDGEFLKRFLDGSLVRLKDTDLLRIIYLHLVHYHRKQSQRRGAVVLSLLTNLEKQLFTIRGQHPSNPDRYALQFSTTLTYYWVQMISAAIAQIPDSELFRLDFASFWENFSYGRKIDSWTEFYTPALFNSIQARKEFVPPDKKPLPNVITIPSTLLPSVHSQHRDLLTKLARSESLRHEHNDELYVVEIKSGEIKSLTHFEFVRFVWIELVRARKKGERRGIAVDRILEVLEGRPDYKGLTETVFWVHVVTTALCSSSHSSSVDTPSQTSDVDVDSHLADALSKKASIKDLGVVASKAKGFRDFVIEVAPDLASPNLIEKYYSKATLLSAEGRALFVSPDLRPLPAYL